MRSVSPTRPKNARAKICRYMSKRGSELPVGTEVGVISCLDLLSQVPTEQIVSVGQQLMGRA